MKRKGYTVPELLVIIGVLGVIALVTITKISFAFENINNPEEQQKEINHLVEQATIAYAKSKAEEFKKSEDIYIYAKEVASAGFLFEKDEYNSKKVKIIYEKETDTFKAEVVE